MIDLISEVLPAHQVADLSSNGYQRLKTTIVRRLITASAVDYIYMLAILESHIPRSSQREGSKYEL